MNEITILTTKVHIEPQFKAPFSQWQVALNTTVAAFPDFVSIEILSPTDPKGADWVILQRFLTTDALKAWQSSKEHQQLIKKLEGIVGADAIQETELEASNLQGGVTEVFVTEV